MCRFTGLQVAPPPDPASVTVPMVDEWQAHTDGIRTLHIIQSLKVAVSLRPRDVWEAHRYWHRVPTTPLLKVCSTPPPGAVTN